MRSSRTLGTELWREIVDRLDEGIVVFSQRGVAIYANDEAARLLDYKRRDVLELEKDDIVALCDRDRIDGERFARAFLAETMPPEAMRPYEIVTASRHLIVRPQALSLEFSQVLLLFISEVAAWRADLIARTVATDMQGPLAGIGHYIDTLIDRLHDQTAHPYELNDLARIVKESLNRAMALWDSLARLYATDPRHAQSAPQFAAVDFGQLAREVSGALVRSLGPSAPALQVDAAPGLPSVRASKADLAAAIYILLEQSAARLPDNGSLLLDAHGQDRYVQVDLIFEPVSCTPHSHYFDLLPLAIPEQIIMRHGGRVWLSGSASAPTCIHFSLPVWSADQTAGKT